MHETVAIVHNGHGHYGRHLKMFLARNPPSSAVTEIALDGEVAAAAAAVATPEAPTSQASAPAMAPGGTASMSAATHLKSRLSRLQREAAVPQHVIETAGDLTESEMIRRRAMWHWTTGYPATLLCAPPAPLVTGPVDFELWRMAAQPVHRHIGLHNMTLGQGFGLACVALDAALQIEIATGMLHSCPAYLKNAGQCR